MRYYLICDNTDTYTGLRMVGVEGVITRDIQEAQSHLEAAIADDSIAVLIISERLAEGCRNRLNDLKLSATRPLIVEIPSRHGTTRTSDSITRYIREAIGVKLE